MKLSDAFKIRSRKVLEQANPALRERAILGMHWQANRRDNWLAWPIESYRSIEVQELLAERSETGPMWLTDVRLGWHNTSRKVPVRHLSGGEWNTVYEPENSALAIHLVLFNRPSGKASWTVAKELPQVDEIGLYGPLGQYMESLGCIWGGRWKRRDLLHFEYHPNITLSIDEGDVGFINEKGLIPTNYEPWRSELDILEGNT